MDHLYNQVLDKMERTLTILEGRVPPPQRVPYKDSFVYRYVEKTLYQAIVQKLVRIVSGLHAARLLMEHGFVQEQGALQRMLDEIEEDIQFLAFAVIFDRFTPLHQEYLDAFYEEEFDAETALESTQKRQLIPRRRIRAYLASTDGAPLDPGRATEVSRTIHKTYSGYVHAASPHIMEMYGGSPPHFHTSGMAGTTLQQGHREDIWNYFYRGILSFVFSAKVFGDEELCQQLNEFAREFAKQSGEDFSIPPRN
ncbi:MAG: hypothetical protein PHP88_01540 [bacterium]|nr:hypothetical protein [bacterium]